MTPIDYLVRLIAVLVVCAVIFQSIVPGELIILVIITILLTCMAVGKES